MTSTNQAVPQPKQPFNRRLRAHGHTQPPSGPMRGHHEGHFKWQQRIGMFLTLVIFFAIAYGVTRNFVQPLLFLGTIAGLIALFSRRGRPHSTYARHARRVRHVP